MPDGQQQRDPCTHSRREPCLAAVRLRNRRDDRQPEPAARVGGPSLPASYEALEGGRGELGRQTGALVGHGEHRPAVLRAADKRDRPLAVAERVAEAIRDITKLRGTVEFVAPGSLPNDGKVIEDARSYK